MFKKLLAPKNVPWILITIILIVVGVIEPSSVLLVGFLFGTLFITFNLCAYLGYSMGAGRWLTFKEFKENLK